MIHNQGHPMTSKQYEEFCRLFLAGLFQLSLKRILTLDIPNPRRLNVSEYSHQIDLYWEIETAAARYLHIANAKWRESPNIVGQGDVLLLEQVKDKVSAHKAFLITNTGFSEQAVAVAVDEGIALHVLKPGFQFGKLHGADPVVIQDQLQNLSRIRRAQPLFAHQVIHKGIAEQVAQAPAVAPASAGATGPSAGLGVKYGVLRPMPAQGGGAPPAPPGGSSRPSGYMTKNGPPPGMLKK
jgi:hypothetical protein